MIRGKLEEIMIRVGKRKSKPIIGKTGIKEDVEEGAVGNERYIEENFKRT